MYRIFFIPVNKFDIRGLKEWLNQKSAHGYKLLSIYNTFAVFDKSNEKPGFYYVFPIQKRVDYENCNSSDIEISNGKKLEFIYENRQMQFFYSESKNYNVNNLHKEYKDTLSDMYNKNKKSLKWDIICSSILLVIYLAFMFSLNQSLIRAFNVRENTLVLITTLILLIINIIASRNDYISLKASLAYFSHDYVLHTNKTQNVNLWSQVNCLLRILIPVLTIILVFTFPYEANVTTNVDSFIQLSELDNIDKDKVSEMRNYQMNLYSVLLKGKYIARQVHHYNKDVYLDIMYYDTYHDVFTNQLINEFKDQIYYAKGANKKLNKFKLPLQDKNVLDDYKEGKNYIYARDDNFQYLILRKDDKVVFYTYNGMSDLYEYINKWKEL